MSLEEIEKRRPQYAAPEFWGGEKPKWENGKKVGTEKVEGWYKEMCYKTVYRAAYNDITIDSQKIDDAYLRMKEIEYAYNEHSVQQEIAENANKTPIDIDPETGEVVDAEFVTEISPAPSVKPKAEENAQPPVGDEETIEGQKDPEFEPGEDPISVALKTGKQEKEEKTKEKKELKSNPKYVAELNKWLDDVRPEMRYACMEEIKKKRFPNMTVEDQDKVLMHYEELTGAAEQTAEPEF